MCFRISQYLLNKLILTIMTSIDNIFKIYNKVRFYIHQINIDVELLL